GRRRVPRLDRGGCPALTCSQASAWGNGWTAVRACDHPVSCALLPGTFLPASVLGADGNSEHLESNSMREKHVVSRRGFLGTAGAATGAAVAAGAFPHPAIGAIKGANEKLNIAVLGSGGRAQEHLRILHRNMKTREQKPVDVMGMCDVWDGNDDVKRGLY